MLQPRRRRSPASPVPLARPSPSTRARSCKKWRRSWSQYLLPHRPSRQRRLLPHPLLRSKPAARSARGVRASVCLPGGVVYFCSIWLCSKLHVISQALTACPVLATRSSRIPVLHGAHAPSRPLRRLQGPQGRRRRRTSRAHQSARRTRSRPRSRRCVCATGYFRFSRIPPLLLLYAMHNARRPFPLTGITHSDVITLLCAASRVLALLGSGSRRGLAGVRCLVQCAAQFRGAAMSTDVARSLLMRTHIASLPFHRVSPFKSTLSPSGRLHGR